MDHALAAAWDAHAETYAELFAPLTGYIARSLFRLAEGRLSARATVLDIACGAGALAMPAVERAQLERARTGHTGLVVATDFAPAMVELTRRAGAAIGAGDDLLRCQIEDGQALSFADASFDAAFSNFGIFLFAQRHAGWREAARVLRPGGTFATAVWQGPADNPMLRAQLGPILAALPPHLAPSPGPGPGSWLDIATADALVAEVTSVAAFVDPRCVPFRASLVLPSAEQAWTALRTNPVLGGLLARCTVDELGAVEASVVGSFAQLAGGPGRPLVLDSVCNLLVATRA